MTPEIWIGLLILGSCVAAVVLYLQRVATGAQQQEMRRRRRYTGISEVAAPQRALANSRDVRRAFYRAVDTWGREPGGVEQQTLSASESDEKQDLSLLLTDDTPSLSLLPFIYMQIKQLLAREGGRSAYTGRRRFAHWAKLLDLIEIDQALTASILKAANEEAPKRIETIEQALLVLGLPRLTKVVESLEPMNALIQYRRDVPEFNWAQFWAHAGNASVAAEELASILFPEQRHLAPRAGLCAIIHDVGKLVLLHHYNSDYSTLLQRNLMAGTDLLEREYSSLDGATHTEVGAIAARKWKWPEGLVNVVQYHHHPWLCSKTPELLMLVHVANCGLTRYLCCGFLD